MSKKSSYSHNREWFFCESREDFDNRVCGNCVLSGYCALAGLTD